MALDPVTAMLDLGGKVIDRLWPDPVQAAQAKLELVRLQQSGDLAQIAGQLEINKVEAARSNPFTSGWRRGLDLRGRVCCAVRGWAPGGMGVCFGGAPGQVPADGPGDDDAAAVRDARLGCVSNGGEGEGGSELAAGRPRPLPFRAASGSL